MHDDFRVPALSDARIRGIANELRSRVSDVADSAPNMIDMIYRVGKLSGPLIVAEISVLDDDLMGDREAYATPDTRRIFLRHSVFDGAEKNLPRDRMTLAHELGHLALGHHAPAARMQSGNKTPKFIDPSVSAERQARVFAAAFLIRPIDLERATSAFELSRICRVSLQAAQIAYVLKVEGENKKRGAPFALDFIELMKKRAGGAPQPDGRGRAAWEAWERASPIQGEDSKQFRETAGGFRIRFQDLDRMTEMGWFIEDGEPIAWYDKVSK